MSPSDFAAVKGETSGVGGVIRFILDSIDTEIVTKWTEADIYSYAERTFVLKHWNPNKLTDVVKRVDR